MSKVLLRFIGRTTDGRTVVAGAYRYCETTGLPLSDLLETLRDRKAVVSWLDYCGEALVAGMEYERILSRIGEALVDVFGPSYRDIVMKKLEDIVSEYGKIVFLRWINRKRPVGYSKSLLKPEYFGKLTVVGEADDYIDD